jgi:hypothetical protein
VSRSIDDIRSAVADLANRWVTYEGTERSASQTFLNQLIAAYTGSDDVMGAGARFEEFGARDEGSGFMDLYWRDVVIVEMKAPSQSRRLDQHRAQALDYWRNSADSEKGVAAPPYLVLCSIRQFEIWEPGKYPTAPVDSFSLAELPDRAESLLFLAGRKPLFGGPGAAVTEQAAEHMVKLFFSLLERKAVEPEELRRFVVQTVWALFAEDLGILEGKPLESLIRALLADNTRSTAVELADLYRRLNTKDDERRNRGRQQSVPYVNGDLFAETTEVHLEANELEHLLQASRFDWRHVNPTVFGSLLEGCLGHNHRWELGAHYTSEQDIMTIVEPVIVRPWVKRIEATKNFKEAVKLHDELCNFKVLDPAMGCGNFLSVAYREIRNLELRLHDRMGEHAAKEGAQPLLDMPWYPIHNIQGIEIDPFAVDIAKTTLWMTHALESRRHGLAEPVLPLPSLTSLVCADSLKTEWPDTDVVVGNPPFHGDSNLRSVLGDSYIDWLKSEFNIGIKDHCIYFFVKAHRHLKPGQRAGLVGTNTISQNKNRDASLVWITDNDGVITDAVSTQPWSGQANVHVSIVCWQKKPISEGDFTLDGGHVEGITPSLKSGTTHRVALPLGGNEGIAFIGNFVNGTEFIIDENEAIALIEKSPQNSFVVKRYLTGDDLVSRVDMSPARWIIDFNTMSLEEAAGFIEPMRIVRERVKPVRDKNRDRRYREVWWQYARPGPALRKAIVDLPRYGVACITGKRIHVIWGEPGIVQSHACVVFAIDDDYTHGVLSSRIHDVWVRGNSSTLEDRLRYTPSTAFESFPFPSSTKEQTERIATASRKIVVLRQQACEQLGKGLTKVYNLMDDGGFVELKAAHRELDLAVADAYGWDAAMLDDPVRLLDALFDLNAKCAADPNYAPFGKNDKAPSLLDLSESEQNEESR